MLGGAAELPCDILPEDAHDDVYLVLWFKDEATKPMYRCVFPVLEHFRGVELKLLNLSPFFTDLMAVIE